MPKQNLCAPFSFSLSRSMAESLGSMAVGYGVNTSALVSAMIRTFIQDEGVQRTTYLMADIKPVCRPISFSFKPTLMQEFRDVIRKWHGADASNTLRRLCRRFVADPRPFYAELGVDPTRIVRDPTQDHREEPIL